jgi:FAD:protein FMN transferase
MNEVVTSTTPSMGGRLEVSIVTEPHRRAAASEAARRAGQRVNAWADRLTRFTTTSDLARLNSADSAEVSIRPTLAAALDWAIAACERTRGIVDPTMLDARLAAESGAGCRGGEGVAARDVDWNLASAARGASVTRPNGVRFDLDGLAKGWIADRAASLLADWRGVAVDADGDIALRADAGVEWLIDVADPRSTAAAPLATLRVTGGDSWTRTYGVATSGTSVHRWTQADGAATHHLIDPRTRRPAETDIVQATVLASTAREAEVIAKAAVILGSADALAYLERSAALACLLLLDDGRVASLPGVETWLA